MSGQRGVLRTGKVSQPHRQTDHKINNYKQIYRSKRLINAKFKFGGAIRKQCVTLKISKSFVFRLLFKPELQVFFLSADFGWEFGF